MSVEQIVLATGHSLFLVNEYLDLIERFKLSRPSGSPRKEEK